MVDCVGGLDVCIVDHAGIFAYNGFPGDPVRAYDVSLKIEAYMKQNARPGATCSYLYDSADEIADENGLLFGRIDLCRLNYGNYLI